jgi:hypothetical protein
VVWPIAADPSDSFTGASNAERNSTKTRGGTSYFCAERRAASLVGLFVPVSRHPPFGGLGGGAQLNWTETAGQMRQAARIVAVGLARRQQLQRLIGPTALDADYRQPEAAQAMEEQGNGPCFPAWCAPEAAALPSGCRSSCKSAPPWLAASSGCHKPRYRDRRVRPSGGQFGRIAVS